MGIRHFDQKQKDKYKEDGLTCPQCGGHRLMYAQRDKDSMVISDKCGEISLKVCCLGCKLTYYENFKFVSISTAYEVQMEG